MKKPTPYMLRSFKGTMVTLVVEFDKHCVVALSNKVSFIHAKVWERDQFDHDYHEARLVDDGVDYVLRQFRGYAKSVGMTPEAAVYLPKLIPMSAEEISTAITLGLATQKRIQKDADNMAQEDGQPTGKAPRKLGGAAAIAVAKKEARLAAEAAALAEQNAPTPPVEEAKPAKPAKPKREAKRKSVTEDERLAAEAKVLAAEVSKQLPDDGKPFKEAKGTRKPVKVEKTTPGKNDSKKVLKGEAVKAAKPADGSFDPATLKTADGKWKSSSAMFKGLLWENKLKTDDKIFAAVQKKFDLSDEKKGYVSWNRGWFRRNNIQLPS